MKADDLTTYLSLSLSHSLSEKFQRNFPFFSSFPFASN